MERVAGNQAIPEIIPRHQAVIALGFEQVERKARKRLIGRDEQRPGLNRQLGVFVPTDQPRFAVSLEQPLALAL